MKNEHWIARDTESNRISMYTGQIDHVWTIFCGDNFWGVFVTDEFSQIAALQNSEYIFNRNPSSSSGGQWGGVWVGHWTVQYVGTFGRCGVTDHPQLTTHPPDIESYTTRKYCKTESLLHVDITLFFLSDFVNDVGLCKKSITTSSLNHHLIFVIIW